MLFLLLFLQSTTTAAPATPIPHVTWYAPFLSGGGYSSEAITYALHLEQTLPANSFSIVQFAEHAQHAVTQGLPAATRHLLKSAMARARVPAAIAICHSTPDVWMPNPNWGWAAVPCPPHNAQYTVGRTMYETDRCPASWVSKLNAMDRIWVPTQFHLQTFKESGVNSKILKVLPEAVDVDFFNPTNHQPLPSLLQLIHEKHLGDSTTAPTPYVFLSVFKWEERKNWKGLLRAYFNEFNTQDNVLLVLKTSPFHNDRPIQEDITDYATALGLQQAPYVVFGHHIKMSELPSLYATANAFVLPSRGEGWGRPHAEAMAMGLPVLATNWSGNTAFMNVSNSMPIPIERLIERKPGDVEGHKWAEPSGTALQKMMRYCVSNPLAAKEIGRVGRRTMEEEYSPMVVGKLVLEELASIAAEIQARKMDL